MRQNRTFLVGALILLASALPLLVGYTYSVARQEKGVGFRYDKTVGPTWVKRVVKRTPVLELGLCRCAPTRTVRLRLPEGLETTASIWDRGGPEARPGVVMIHGNTWLGRNLSTYRLMAEILAAHGFIVLTFDQFGFGESDDPFGRGPGAVAAAYSFGSIEAALDHLIEHTPVDPARISILGHSGGVEPALMLGNSRPEITNVVLFPAPPSPRAGDVTPETEEQKEERSQYFSQRFRDTYQFIYGHDIPDWFSWDMTDRVGVPRRLNAHTGLSECLATNRLVLLGERDQPDGHPYVKAGFDMWAEPKELIVLRRADHYLNTAQSLGFVVYDRTIARQIATDVVPWLLEGTAG